MNLKCNAYCYATRSRPGQYRRFSEEADDGIRTRDLLITNQLLYQLSYVGAFGLGK